MYDFIQKIFNFIYKNFYAPILKISLKEHGHSIHIGRKFYANKISNVSIGNRTSIGRGATFVCTRAEIKIGSYVMFGPNVTIVPGNHRTDIKGKYMIDITDSMKRPEDDMPVIIHDDVWIGANVTILKGVTIGEGAVIAAGSVVNKDVLPYSIIGGVPAKKISMRFTESEIHEHKKELGI